MSVYIVFRSTGAEPFSIKNRKQRKPCLTEDFPVLTPANGQLPFLRFPHRTSFCRASRTPSPWWPGSCTGGPRSGQSRSQSSSGDPVRTQASGSSPRAGSAV